MNLGTEEDRKEIKIRANLEPRVKQRWRQMLRDDGQSFAWSYEDMPGLDTDIVVHRLPTKENCPQVKQKVHRMRHEMSENQSRGHETVRCRVLSCHFLSTVGCQCRTGTKGR